jgi:glutathione S-transferase
MARHPFGKVPVLDHEGFRIIEADAVVPYLGEVLPGPSFTPEYCTTTPQPISGA